MPSVEIILALVLFVGALLHVYGSFLAFPAGSPELVWSVGAAGFAILLSVLAALNARRAADRPLSWVVGVASLGWVGVVAAFGIAIGNPADPRVLYHLVVGLLLAVLALRRAVAR